MYTELIILIIVLVLYLYLRKIENFVISDTSPDLKVINKLLPYNVESLPQKEENVSQNIQIDRNVMNILSSIRNVEIDTLLPNDTIITTSINPEFREIQSVNNYEKDQILKAFINYINISTGYSFSILETTKTDLYLSSPQMGTITKKFVIYLYIYEKTIGYTKRLIVTFIKTENKTVSGNIIIENIEIPLDAKLDNRPLLPGINESVKINTITNEPGYHIADDKPKYTLVSKEDIEKEAERRIYIEKLRKEYKCFGVPQGELITNKLECINFGGVWDRPVEDPNECPYYNANKNYLNERGNVKNDYCEMPDGIQIKGYRFYKEDPDSFKPMCYNCKTDLIGQGTLGYCCDSQAKDKLKYPTLKSPDYKFPGDSLDRFNNRTDIYSLNLSVN
jgi:hypothetical protein